MSGGDEILAKMAEAAEGVERVEAALARSGARP